jgi:hypothetical protein
MFGVRWYHTTRILKSPKNILHPFTAKFIQDPYVILALLNQLGQTFVEIQHFSKKIKHWPKLQIYISQIVIYI